MDKAMVIENKYRQMEDKKRKFQGQQSGSNYRFCTNSQQTQPQQCYQGQFGLINHNQQPQCAQ